MSLRIVEAATHGAHGFDANVTISKASAKKFKEAGFVFAVRYLTRLSNPARNDLTKEEVQTILDAGLALMAVQHVAREGWNPSKSLGKTYGGNAAAHARNIGLPEGTTVWLDLEGVDNSVASDTVVEYCNEWHRAVEDGGYRPGIYVGANCGLSGDQLYFQLRMKYYWESGSRVPDIPIRGYCMRQRIIAGDRIGNVRIDRNVVFKDSFGMTPYWVTGSSLAIPIPLEKALSEQGVHEDEAILMTLAKDLGLSEPMDELIAYRNTYRPNSNPRYWCIVNFNLHSNKPRMFIFDVTTSSSKAYLCAHGKGSEGRRDDGYANVFSNEDGSNCSSLGIYRCAETYYGDHGLSLRLDGLETTNSNARHRAIVIHGANYVSADYIEKHGRLGRSLGCPAVENDVAKDVVTALANGSLLNIWHRG